MSAVAIVGGHGKVARQLIPQLVEAGHSPVALVRNPDYTSELESLGAQVRLLDIEASDAGDFAAAFEGCDAVVFAAGGGADGNIERKRTVDLEGSTKSADGAVKAGVTRFVQVSAIGVDAELPADTGDVWRAYVEAKRDADAHLRGTDLEWTILRPGTLTDDEATGTIELAPHVERGEITRADVAAAVVACLAEPASAGQQWELVAGDQPVTEAVAELTSATSAGLEA